MVTPTGSRIAAAIAETGFPKAFRRGTHLIVEPSETLARYRPLASLMGITRLGNITGLDRIGIPVVAAIRLNSRSVSASQGKGLDLPQALMEAVEGFHAEEVGERRRAAYRELAREKGVVDPSTLSTQRHKQHRSDATQFDRGARDRVVWDLRREYGEVGDMEEDPDHQASGAGQLHPRALSEPDVILSHHPAPIVRPRPIMHNHGNKYGGTKQVFTWPMPGL